MSVLSMAAVDRSKSKRDNIFFYLFIATLAISVIVVAFLVYSIKKLKKNSHVYSNGKQNYTHCISICQTIFGKS